LSARKKDRLSEQADVSAVAFLPVSRSALCAVSAKLRLDEYKGTLDDLVSLPSCGETLRSCSGVCEIAYPARANLVTLFYGVAEPKAPEDAGLLL